MLAGMTTALLTAFVTGFGLGFFVAAQVGPISLLCVRSVLRGRLATGLGIGLGAAIIDTCYAALGVAGVTQLLRVKQLRLALGLAGAAVLLVIGGRTLWSALRIRTGLEADEETVSPGRALRTSLIATASNPGRPPWAAPGRRHIRPGHHRLRRPAGLAHRSCRPLTLS
jgi:putative LysE/RhtB family amino acid efflux pump